ncbi:hypothetical protein ACOSP7_028086 [Xanthoceras sorbifolium]
MFRFAVYPPHRCRGWTCATSTDNSFFLKVHFIHHSTAELFSKSPSLIIQYHWEIERTQISFRDCAVYQRKNFDQSATL